MFPHLAPDATWTEQNNAAQRLRSIYEAERPKNLKSVGLPDYEGPVIVRCPSKKSGGKAWSIGLNYRTGMARGMVVHRAMARIKGGDRRHHIENALRIRDALCWGGLCAHRRTTV